MSYREAMRELRSLGTAQNRKVYARHGVRGDAFGVSYANQNRLARKYRGGHDLALELWRSGNHDARILASMIADPQAMSRRDLEDWMKDVDCYVTAGAVTDVAARGAHARPLAERWRKTRGEWTSTVAWSLVGHLARDPAADDDYLAARLADIERDIHQAQNRTRHAMNGALIAIGGYRPRLEGAAIAAARRIGRVEVDHGKTGCKTPDAAAYIARMAARARQKKKATRKKTTTKKTTTTTKKTTTTTTAAKRRPASRGGAARSR